MSELETLNAIIRDVSRMRDYGADKNDSAWRRKVGKISGLLHDMSEQTGEKKLAELSRVVPKWMFNWAKAEESPLPRVPSEARRWASFVLRKLEDAKRLYTSSQSRKSLVVNAAKEMGVPVKRKPKLDVMMVSVWLKYILQELRYANRALTGRRPSRVHEPQKEPKQASVHLREAFETSVNIEKLAKREKLHEVKGGIPVMLAVQEMTVALNKALSRGANRDYQNSMVKKAMGHRAKAERLIQAIRSSSRG